MIYNENYFIEISQRKGYIIMAKKIILFDLDGVLNMYDGNYDGNYIPPIKDGAYNLIKELSEKYRIIIFTARNILSVSKWVFENGLDEYVENVTNVKVPAYLIIDDRCINFNGNYADLTKEIKDFKTWYQK